MIQSGIDEAGLGPLLGPYCAGLVSLSYPASAEDPRTLGSSILSYTADAGKIAVGDSKKLSSSRNIATLEETVLAFYFLKEKTLPSTAGELIRKLTAYDLDESGDREPWKEVISNQALPLVQKKETIRQKAEYLDRYISAGGLKLLNFLFVMVPPGNFNLLLDRWKNKAKVCQEILSPLLKKGRESDSRLVVDRQGGRRYYGDWLIELFPGDLLAARQETSQLSLYQSGSCEIIFQVGADEECFETALASMVSKYLREIYMKGFNLYWQNRVPGLKETAGYYSDGKRFIRDLQEAGVLPEDLSLLVRNK